MAEVLTEKEKIWLAKRAKAQKFFLVVAIFCFICSIFYLFVYLTSSEKNIYLHTQSGYAFTIAFISGCFLMGIRMEANKFLKVIAKLQ